MIGGVTLGGGPGLAAGGGGDSTNIHSPSPAPLDVSEPRDGRSRTATASATPGPVDPLDPDVTMRDASESTPQPPVQRASSLRRVPSVGVASSRAPSIGRDRPVGGLLGSQSQFKGAGAGGSATGATTGKPKFRPNVAAAAARKKEKEQQYSEDEDDVKMEDDSWKKRGPRPARPRQELEMTASGPMAQGPGGAPRTWGARPATASGAAVMAASREGTLNAQLNQDEDASDLEGGEDSDGGSRRIKIRATDLNDIGLSDGGSDGENGKGVPPLVLPRDPKVLRTKIRRLQERKTERLKKEALRASSSGDQLQVKAEPRDDSMSIEGTPNATPGPSEARSAGTLDSKESTFAGFDADEKEAKDLKDLEEEEKKEINLSEAFDFQDTNRLDLYMFQFPRKFPVFTPKQRSTANEAKGEAPEAESDGENDNKKKKQSSSKDKSVKPDPEGAASQTATAAVRKPVPPEWGRSGTRVQKAARWSEEPGKIGKLRVHRSGKVTLKLHGDLKYEVLPAAQPSFLQEIAVLDHPVSTKKKEDDKGKGKKGKSSIFKKKKKAKKAKSNSSDESNASSNDSDSNSDDDEDEDSDSDTDDQQPRWNKKDPPPESLVCIGQTSKKFIVVPEITDLLSKVALQEKAEKDAERAAKGLKVSKGLKKEK